MGNKAQDLLKQLTDEIVKYNPYYDKKLIDKAYFFAEKAHEGHYRKSGELYITHPLYTAIYLTKIEADDISIVSALLHDVLDNEAYTPKILEKEFGKEVSIIVEGIHKLGDIYYTSDMNKKDIENLKNSLVTVGDDIRIFLVKVADRFHNMKTLEFMPKEKRYRIAKETQEIYLPIVNFLSIGEFLSEMQDLCFKYTHEDEYKQLYKLFGKKYECHKNKIIHANNKVELELKESNIGVEKIEGRVKTLYSIYKKMNGKHLDVNEIHDVLALRIITKNKKDCYLVLGVLHKIYKIKQDRFKDYISSPKDNGYQSIHTTVYDESGELIEFQIQSIQMYKLNNTGLAAHFIYKGFGIDYKMLPEWMSKIMDVQKQVLDQKKFIEKLKNEVIISEIKCFGGDGKFVSLPKGACLIDFAFESNKDYGKYFEGAYINGNYTQDPFQILNNGDFIILKKGVNIKKDYNIENFFGVKTHTAREELKNIFKKYSKTKLITLGKYMLNNSLEVYSLRYFENYPQKTKQIILQKFGLGDEKQLYLFLAIGSVEIDQVVEKIISLSTAQIRNKEVTIRIFLKTKDFDSINHIISIIYNLDLDLNNIQYVKKKGTILMSLSIDNKPNLDALLSELKRAPNVSSIDRVFPKRLKIYYFLFFGSVFFVLLFIALINIFDIAKYERTIYFNVLLIFCSMFLIFIAYFLKYLVRSVLPDVLKYKRYWLSLILLNTFILLAIFYEILYLEISLNFIFYIFFSSIMYGILIYDYMKYRQYRKT